MKNIIVCVGTDDSKNIRVRLSLIADEGMPPLYHSVSLVPGADPALVRIAIENDLARPYSESGIPGAPWPKIPDEEWAEVEAIESVIHTPQRIQKRHLEEIAIQEVVKISIAK